MGCAAPGTSLPNLADNDVVPLLLTWLRSHPAVVDAFGGPDHVSGTNRAPYPMLEIIPTPGGDDRDLRWITDTEIKVSVYGPLDGTLGDAMLRRLLYTAVDALAELPAAGWQPGFPVITRIRSGGGSGGPVSTTASAIALPPSRQRCWGIFLIVTSHPPPSRG